MKTNIELQASHAVVPAEGQVVNQRHRSGLIASVRSNAAKLNLSPIGETYVRTAADAPFRRVRSTANPRHARIARHAGRGAMSPASQTKRRYVANFEQAEVSVGNAFLERFLVST